MIANPKSALNTTVTEPSEQGLDDLEQTIAIVGGCQTSENLAVSFGSNFNIVHAGHANELFKAYEQQDIDLIILSASGDNGLWIEQLKKIHEHPVLNFIPIIVLTQNDSVNQQLIALELGAMDCLVIPPNPFLLYAKVNNYMKFMKNVKQLELISCTDGLTGLPNRTQLDTTLTKEWYRMKRSQSTLSILMIDVDYFKDFNDKFGHLTGDEALKAVASAMAKVAGRESDFAARFGGEEFVILLPCTDYLGAQKLAESVLQEIQALAIPSANKSFDFLTVSIGISSCEPHKKAEQETGPNNLLDEADQNLYKAKQQGRNKYNS